MSFLEVVQLVGYGFGGLMTLWMCSLLLRRSSLRPVERVLIALGLSIGIWHVANLATTVGRILDASSSQRLSFPLKLADSVAVVSVTFAYSFLLHIHLHLWADSHGRSLSRQERVRVLLSYIPCLFLTWAVPHIWDGNYIPMLERFQLELLPFWPWVTYQTAFSIWAVYVLLFISVTDLLIGQRIRGSRERYFLRTLAACFLAIATLLLLQGAIGLWRGASAAAFINTLINLGSLLPTALIAFYIYRYRYLELIIRDSLVLAVFSVLVLALYLLLVRSFTAWLVAHYELRAAGVEALLILALAVAAVPLKRVLDLGFKRLFEKEAGLYRDVLARINDHRGQYRRLPELLHFIEQTAVDALGLGALRIVTTLDDGPAGTSAMNSIVSGSSERDCSEIHIAKRLIERMAAKPDKRVIDGLPEEMNGFDRVYRLRRKDLDLGVMFVSAPLNGISDDTDSILLLLAEQVTIAIDDSRLVMENVRLESELARGERLAALGQVAATIAHEVKNPLSAIKSIAQVMKEEREVGERYEQDLSLIISETDRLSRSVGQMLSFARTSNSYGAGGELGEIIRSAVELHRASAGQRRISISLTPCESVALGERETQALRDALSNLIDNALQAVNDGGEISLQVLKEAEEIVISVSDTGPGVPIAIAERIWQPFFTTRQRGTGLGLAIVLRRIQEIGGRVELAPPLHGQGACFILRLPLVSGL